MLEVKRKPNGFASRGTATATATAKVPAHISDATTTRTRENPPRPAVIRRIDMRDCQTRLPVITGEAHYRGSLHVDGIINGQLGGNSGLNMRQKSRATVGFQPELSGEFSFKDMVRVNGFIAGTVYSEKGTLIVDVSARVDANVEVAVAVISGTVNGDIVAHERVELGPCAKISGNIWTRAISIKDGAVFDGVCRMIEE